MKMHDTDEPSRVLFAVRRLSGHEGITTHLQLLIQELVTRNWQVAVVSSTKSLRPEGIDFFNWIEDKGVENYYVPFPAKDFSFDTLQNAITSIHELDRVYNEWDPHIVHVFSPFSLSPYTYIMRLLRGVPYVSSCRVSPQPDRLEVKFARVASRISSRYLGDQVIAISSKILNEYRDLLHVPNQSTSLVLNGVNEEHFHPPSREQRASAREKFGLTSEDNVICLVRRLGRTKGHDVIIRALAELRSEDLNVKVLFAGSGDHKKTIEQEVQRFGVGDAVHFLGFVEPRPVYWASDVIALPSIREGFANAVAEGMHCGLVPVRTPAAGATDQVEDGQNGYIIPFGDSVALAARLRCLFQSEEKRYQMAKAAVETAKRKFSAQEMARNMCNVYDSVLLNYQW